MIRKCLFCFFTFALVYKWVFGCEVAEYFSEEDTVIIKEYSQIRRDIQNIIKSGFEIIDIDIFDFKQKLSVAVEKIKKLKLLESNEINDIVCSDEYVFLSLAKLFDDDVRDTKTFIETAKKQLPNLF